MLPWHLHRLGGRPAKKTNINIIRAVYLAECCCRLGAWLHLSHALVAMFHAYKITPETVGQLVFEQ